MKLAYLFPGQGAQKPGMGRDLYERCPEARAVFDEAARILGDELLETIFYGPAEKLQRTEYAQPALLTVSTALHCLVAAAGLTAEAAAGLSLGEYSALVAAGALAFADALPLVQKRGRFMQEAVPPGQGAMAAVMGLERDRVEQICAAAREEGVVSTANYNCPGQVVISGETPAVERAAALARAAGAKRVVRLQVSAPFHCPLMAPVEPRLERELAGVELAAPSIPVVLNVSARFERNPERIKKALIRQVSSPVLWEQSMSALIGAGFDTFVELGPGGVLTGLMKKIDSRVWVFAVEDCASLERALHQLQGAAC
ncbi:MAG: ACP S-malonyltransferase [Firmicutes bacterium]|nr:ACP S-malonyltransferase [Bacillota bacterium]HPU01563.1 ACP S-malonyltransferase [Bacillota bacterium]